MTLLQSIRGPHDLKALNASQLGELADDIRTFLVQAVARTGAIWAPTSGWWS